MPSNPTPQDLIRKVLLDNYGTFTAIGMARLIGAKAHLDYLDISQASGAPPALDNKSRHGL